MEEKKRTDNPLHKRIRKQEEELTRLKQEIASKDTIFDIVLDSLSDLCVYLDRYEDKFTPEDNKNIRLIFLSIIRTAINFKEI